MRILLAIAMAVAAFGAIPSSGSRGQEPEAKAFDTPQSVDMWFYQQMLERYDDPKVAIRRKAELRSQQRRARIAALQWYGMSKSRPQAAPHPFTSMYSPTWQASRLRPYAWFSTGRSPIVVPYGHQVYR